MVRGDLLGVFETVVVNHSYVQDEIDTNIRIAKERIEKACRNMLGRSMGNDFQVSLEAAIQKELDMLAQSGVIATVSVSEDMERRGFDVEIS